MIKKDNGTKISRVKSNLPQTNNRGTDLPYSLRSLIITFDVFNVIVVKIKRFE